MILACLLAALVVVIAGLTLGNYLDPDSESNASSAAETNQPTEKTEVELSSEPKAEPEQESEDWDVEVAEESKAAVGAVTDPTDIRVLVNKLNPLTPASFAPSDLVSAAGAGVTDTDPSIVLRAEAAEHAAQMSIDAAAAGAGFGVTSGFRSYETQNQLYSNYSAVDGQAAADTYSARPSFSEHQTGLAFDAIAPAAGCYDLGCFGSTPAAGWLAQNSWQYGFILRYPEGSQPVVGYMYEPWHFRYIGVDLARDYHESGAATYEEFLGEPAAPNYAN